MCVMAAIFSISCMLLVNWLVSVCMCAWRGKVKSSIPLCSRSSHLCSPSQSNGADPWLNALEKPKVTQEKTRLESTEIGGKMRRIVSKGRRIYTPESSGALPLPSRSSRRAGNTGILGKWALQNILFVLFILFYLNFRHGLHCMFIPAQHISSRVI